MTDELDKRLPTDISLTINSAVEAIEYWLDKVVLKPDTKVSSVIWHSSESVFRITLNRELKKENE